MRSLEELDRWIATRVKGWTSKVSGPSAGKELLEIRREILQDIRDRIEPRGDGRSIFPYATVSISIAAESEQQSASFQSAFLAGNDLERDIRGLLAQARCPIPAGFTVQVAGIEDQALAWTDRPFRIEYSRETTAPRRSATARPAASLTVVRGKAEPARWAIAADRTNLGRLAEVVGEREGLRRRNDVAFADTETSVSREHAVIGYDNESGRYRLYDSHSQRGTSIFREGRRIEVPRGATRGIQLHSGDEIHLGEAIVRFEIETERKQASQ